MNKKSTSDEQGYSTGGVYWDRVKPQVMGDIRQRPDLLKFIGNIQGKNILDMGCGTGYFTRKLAETGAKVFGCDIEPNMLNIAKTSEQEKPIGISYDLYDVRKTLYESGFFDVVVSVGVLFHLDREGWKSFLSESHRVLVKEGKLVFSIEHPFLFTKYSPTRTSKVCWAIHKPYSDQPYEESQKFEEIYYKADGTRFSSVLWHHPLEFIINSVIECGFVIEKIKEIPIEKQDLQSPHWGEEYGYPGFLQIKAKKV